MNSSANFVNKKAKSEMENRAQFYESFYLQACKYKAALKLALVTSRAKFNVVRLVSSLKFTSLKTFPKIDARKEVYSA